VVVPPAECSRFLSRSPGIRSAGTHTAPCRHIRAQSWRPLNRTRSLPLPVRSTHALTRPAPLKAARQITPSVFLPQGLVSRRAAHLPMARGPHNSIHEIDYSPSNGRSQPCRCDEPVGDPRDMTCIRCGRQVAGVPLPSRVPAFTLRDGSSFATKRRHIRPAP
jgi:hypothetical protein